jgi:hypothetical protein
MAATNVPHPELARAAGLSKDAMSLSKRITLAAMLVITVTASSRAEEPTHATSANLPPDVITFIGRRADCEEYAAKTDLSVDIRMQRERALNCDGIAADERVLRLKYATDSAATAALDGHWIKIVRRLPVPTDQNSAPSKSASP